MTLLWPPGTGGRSGDLAAGGSSSHRPVPFWGGQVRGGGASGPFRRACVRSAARSGPSGWAQRQGRLVVLSSSADRWRPGAAGDRERDPGPWPETPGREAESTECRPRWRACGSGLQPEDSSGVWAALSMGARVLPEISLGVLARRHVLVANRRTSLGPSPGSPEPGTGASLSATARAALSDTSPCPPRGWPDPW